MSSIFRSQHQFLNIFYRISLGFWTIRTVRLSLPNISRHMSPSLRGVRTPGPELEMPWTNLSPSLTPNIFSTVNDHNAAEWPDEIDRNEVIKRFVIVTPDKPSAVNERDSFPREIHTEQVSVSDAEYMCVCVRWRLAGDSRLDFTLPLTFRRKVNAHLDVAVFDSKWLLLAVCSALWGLIHLSESAVNSQSLENGKLISVAVNDGLHPMLDFLWTGWGLKAIFNCWMF